VLSTYNVHIPVQLPSFTRGVRRFLADMRDRSEERKYHYRILASAVMRNTCPAVIAGDFNATALTGDMRPLRRITRDAIRASGARYPVSWHAQRRPLRLWRLDWALLRGGVTAVRYEFVHPGLRSDHRIQRLLVTAGGPDSGSAVRSPGASAASYRWRNAGDTSH
jgi:endonuclease/exonuclease/phosphatase family metal-dependent hydrolase